MHTVVLAMMGGVVHIVRLLAVVHAVPTGSRAKTTAPQQESLGNADANASKRTMATTAKSTSMIASQIHVKMVQVARTVLLISLARALMATMVSSAATTLTSVLQPLAETMGFAPTKSMDLCVSVLTASPANLAVPTLTSVNQHRARTEATV